MSIIQKPFNSDTGFSAPGFAVDTNGNISFSGSLQQNGVSIITATTISSNVVYSSLRMLGTLDELTVDGDVNVSGGDVTITPSGVLTITSGTTGSIDNVSIGLTTPAAAKFTTVTVVDSILVDGQTVLTANPTSTRTLDNYNIGSINPKAGTFTTLSATTNVNIAPTTTGTINNTSIGNVTAATGRFTNVVLTQEPTQTTHATSKNYVDSRISAYAIALGA